ncbi:MAG: cbb3-type cytochrome oxidase assembly protein CcoS [Alphaproteobacteria bacterium]|nr:cbb3-type cytochrome oxidase assembly protein CcoS [Alphaproteobacteria bacterium]
MSILVILIPVALGLGLIGLLAFLWSLKSGQYKDLDGDAWRALNDESDEKPSRR